jgi:hypothetical protein
MKTASPSAKAKIARLYQIAVDLRAGKSFSVTRLTTIKSLCVDNSAARTFALHVAKLSKQKMDARDNPNSIEPSQWLRFKQVVSRAVIDLERAQEEGADKCKPRLLQVLQELKNLQNTYEHQEWGPVRLVSSSETLVVEYAVECSFLTSQAPYWAYLLARTYAEQYDSRFGNGLVPASAAMIEEIATFWNNYYSTRP